MYDKDEKGFVTVDEMKQKLCNVIPSFPEAEAEATFKETAGKRRGPNTVAMAVRT